MRWLINKVVSFLSVYYAHMLEYRAEIFFWVLSGSLPIILMGVWIQASQGGDFALNSVEFARYFFCVFQVKVNYLLNYYILLIQLGIMWLDILLKK